MTSPALRRFRGAAAALTAAVAAALLAGCAPTTGDAPPSAASTSPPAPASTTSTASAGSTLEIDVDGRPFRLHLPPGLDPATAAPLVVGLHGYTSNASELDSYFGLTAASDERGFLLALPEGTVDPDGDQFWNALEGGCCDFYGADVDDSGYLALVVDAVSAAYAVDQVVLVGHSNGAYLAHRFACEHADRVSAIATLAGTLPADTSGCDPSGPVSVLHIHGDADDVVPYDGGQGGASASDTAEVWADLNGCDPTPDEPPALDLSTLPGDETTAIRFARGCRDGRSVVLWTIRDGGHVPDLGPAFTPAVLDFLLGPRTG